MPRATIELDVIERSYELITWASHHLEKFPKTYRFTLGDRVGNRLYEVLELLIEAKYTTDRQSLLKKVNLNLEVLRFQFRLAKDFQCWSIEQYGVGSRKIDDVGKLVGGWLKQKKQSNDETARISVGQPDQFPQPAARGKQSAAAKKPPPECGDVPF